MAATIDWPAVHAEALDILVRYLRVDSSNPPGQEAAAARFLGAVIEAEGIACEYIETRPGREVVVARLPGDGSGGALMLCNHLDVVPAEEEHWELPPFGGELRDGRIYGRGALDMKGAGVMQLMSFLLAHRLRLPLRRDLVFCAVPDEEAGGRWGMGWLCEHRPDVVDVAYEINEGGSGLTDFAGQEGRLFTVSTSEKEICWLRLRASGTAGHGSRPHPDNAVTHLVRALARLAEWERPLTFTPETRAMIDRIAAAGMLPAAGDTSVTEDALEEALRADPGTHALFINTLNITMLDAGIKANVIPATAEATLDCRLLPGTSREQWRAQVQARIADPRVEVEFIHPAEGEMVTGDWDTELFRVMEAVVTEAIEDAVVTPSMMWGGTDNRFLRRRGIPAYGFIPCLLSPEERAGFHAHNEFLTVDNLNMGCELMYEVVRRMCT